MTLPKTQVPLDKGDGRADGLNMKRMLVLIALFGLALSFTAFQPSSGSILQPVVAQEDEAQEPPPPPPPSPVPTRRPTRTPQSAPPPTATPLPAGALQLTLWFEPPQPATGQRFSAVVQLTAVGDEPQGAQLLEVLLPRVMQVETVTTDMGDSARAGTVVRWRLQSLPVGATTTLQAVGIALREGGEQSFCALLVSRAAPLEHCVALTVSTAEPRAEVLPPDIETAPIGVGLEDVAAGQRQLAGWAVLLVGLAVLGGWAGASMGSRRRKRDSVPVTSEGRQHE